jgi:hypothetical protein
VDPTQQGGGVFSSLNGAIAEAAVPLCDAPWSLVAVSNESMNQRLVQHLDHSPAVQLRIDAREHADPSARLPLATRGDADGISELSNRANGGLELSRTRTADDVVARAESVGPRYGWSRISFSDGALLGVDGLPVKVETRTPEQTEVRREAYACDLAVIEGHEHELLDLVRAWCTRLLDEGIDDLVITAASPLLRRHLEPLASYRTYFNLNHQFAVASDADARGYFIDGMYF